MRFANAHRDAVALVVSQQRPHVSDALGTEHRFSRCAPQCRVVGVNSIPVLSDSFARLRLLPLDRNRISVSAPLSRNNWLWNICETMSPAEESLDHTAAAIRHHQLLVCFSHAFLSDQRFCELASIPQ